MDMHTTGRNRMHDGSICIGNGLFLCISGGSGCGKAGSVLVKLMVLEPLTKATAGRVNFCLNEPLFGLLRDGAQPARAPAAAACRRSGPAQGALAYGASPPTYSVMPAKAPSSTRNDASVRAGLRPR